MEPIVFKCRRNAHNLGVFERPIKGGTSGYLIRRGSNIGGTSNSSRSTRAHGGLNQHNSPISYDLQPKKGYEAQKIS